MALLNHAKKELSAKIVYYGPGLSGKTTNLEWIHRKLSPDKRGKLISLETKTDRTLFFDFLPVQIGEIAGFRTRFNVYTVPGQIFYNETRRMVLKGVDGIVFVADSQKEMANENLENLKNLAENLRSIGKELSKIPLVMQFNKRDLPNILSVEEMNRLLNAPGLPFFEAVAVKGEGVLTTLTRISRVVADHLNNTLFDGQAAESTAGRTRPLPPPEARHEPPPAFQDGTTEPADSETPAFLTQPSQAASVRKEPTLQVSSHDQVISAQIETFSRDQDVPRRPQRNIAAVPAQSVEPLQSEEIPSLGDLGEPPEGRPHHQPIPKPSSFETRPQAQAARPEQMEAPRQKQEYTERARVAEKVIPFERTTPPETADARPVSTGPSAEQTSPSYWVDPSLVTVTAEQASPPDPQKGIALRFGEPEREAGNQVRIPVALRLEATNEILSFQMVIRVEQEPKPSS